MAEAKKNILTPDGLKALEDELQELKVVRVKRSHRRSKKQENRGDLSENAEYDAAKDEQRDMEARIEEIEKILKNAVVIDEKFEKGVISLGCHVLLEDITLGKEVTYHIVGSTEADILQNKIPMKHRSVELYLEENRRCRIRRRNQSGKRLQSH